MALYEVFTQPIRLRYKASVCSKASVFYFIATVLTIVPPLIITYTSQGFWQKISFYREQPEVHFKHKMMVILETLSPDRTIIWTSYPKLNKYLKSDMTTRIPAIQLMEIDVNRDGKNDKLEMSIKVPLTDEEVHSVKVLLLFDYKLHLYSSFRMECLSYIDHSSPLAGGALHTTGELALHQREPLWHKGIDLRYNIPVIDEARTSFDVYKLENIFKSYSERNVTTYYKSPHPVWFAGRGPDMPFHISLTVLYPEETIQYRLGFWQLLKWAWIQYLSLLAVFWVLFLRIKTYVFQNQLVSSIVFSPLKQNV